MHPLSPGISLMTALPELGDCVQVHMASLQSHTVKQQLSWRLLRFHLQQNIVQVIQRIYTNFLHHQGWKGPFVQWYVAPFSSPVVILIDNNMIILKISTSVTSKTYNNSLLLCNYLTWYTSYLQYTTITFPSNEVAS